MEKMKDHLGEVFDVGDEITSKYGDKRFVVFVNEEGILIGGDGKHLKDIKNSCHTSYMYKSEIDSRDTRITKKRFLGKDKDGKDVCLGDRIKPDSYIEGFAVDYRKGRFIVEYDEVECKDIAEMHTAEKVILSEPKFPKEEKPNIQILHDGKLVYDNKEPLSVETARGMKIIK